MAASVPSVTLNSGAKMPILGLGTWMSKDDVLTATLKAALDIGYRSFDTAYVYRNEAVIGAALQDYFKSGKLKREDVFITSKISLIHLKQEYVREAFLKSLNLLKLDYIDLMLFHGPCGLTNLGDDNAFPMTADHKLLNDHYDHLESWKELEKLVDEGKIKSIGVSNYAQEHVEKLYDSARIKPAVNQIECHPYLPHTSFLKFCKSKNIHITAYSCLGAPSLPKFLVSTPGAQLVIEDPILREVGKKHNKSTAQIALRWQTQRGVIVIPKTVTPSRLKENFNIFDIELSSEDMKKINGIKTRIQYVSFKDIGGNDHQDFIPYTMDYP